MLRPLSNRLQRLHSSAAAVVFQPNTMYDFDAWGYHIDWPPAAAPSSSSSSPSPSPERLTQRDLPLLHRCSTTVEDIKFAFNAWMLLRLCMFYGTEHPSVLSRLRQTTPSMDIAVGANRLFYHHCNVGSGLSPKKVKVALTPSDPRAVSLLDFDWEAARKAAPDEGIELVLGMENGMSQRVIDACDHCVYLPQYGSIGSLSMLSALAVTLHHGHMNLAPGLPSRPTSTAVVASLPSAGHQPESHPSISTSSEATRKKSDSTALVAERRPHETSLLSLSNQDICELLAARRATYPLQLSILMRNDLGDRNIGAVVRNANAYNCERMIVTNRKKFSMRGTVGCHHYLDMRYPDSVEIAVKEGLLQDYEVWLLVPTYPYLRNYLVPDALDRADCTLVQCKKGSQLQRPNFLRPQTASFRNWMDAQEEHYQSLTDGRPCAAVQCASHPLYHSLCALVGETKAQHVLHPDREVYLDDPQSLLEAVQNGVQRQRGLRGIMLAVPEEGTTPHPDLLRVCDRVVYVVHPSRLPQRVQRGLSPALSTAVALERLRSTIDRLASPQPN